MSKIKGVKGSFELPIETFTIVPSTKDKTKKISTKAFNKRVKQTVRKLRSLFGGSTRVKGHGEYKLKGKYVPEKVAIVYSYAKRNRFLKKKKEWIAWVKKKRREWGQDSMAIGIENDLYYV